MNFAYFLIADLVSMSMFGIVVKHMSNTTTTRTAENGTSKRDTTKAANQEMKELLQDESLAFSLPHEGEVIEGTVIEKGRNRVYLNLGPLRMGVVYKSELDLSLYDMNTVEIGDVLPAKVMKIENEDSLVELSLREAGLEKVWKELRKTYKDGEVFTVQIHDANRGGLMTKVKGIQAFLPVSQLSPENYPHVEGGDKEEIYRRLQEFVGEELEVKILDLNQKDEKLILSERAKVSKEVQEKLDSYEVGQVVEGEVTGIVDFGAFVTFNGIEGLVHISELGWQLVEDPANIVSIGETVKAKVIAIEDDKVSLSIKALKPNPWDSVAEKYSVGDTVEGEVVKHNPFGAFVRVEPEIQGLSHISEFEDYDDMTQKLKLGETYTFRITMLNPDDYKMALAPTADEESQAETAAEVAESGEVTDDAEDSADDSETPQE